MTHWRVYKCSNSVCQTTDKMEASMSFNDFSIDDIHIYHYFSVLNKQIMVSQPDQLKSNQQTSALPD